jgi:hypothetical protein
MKTLMPVLLLFFIMSLLWCRESLAKECSTDMDCNMYENERCIIPASESRGVCGKPRSTPKEITPLFSPPASPPASSKRGRSCMTAVDCDPGQSCVKKGDALVGTCL